MTHPPQRHQAVQVGDYLQRAAVWLGNGMLLYFRVKSLNAISA